MGFTSEMMSSIHWTSRNSRSRSRFGKHERNNSDTFYLTLRFLELISIMQIELFQFYAETSGANIWSEVQLKMMKLREFKSPFILLHMWHSNEQNGLFWEKKFLIILFQFTSYVSLVWKNKKKNLETNSRVVKASAKARSCDICPKI